jgi:hypothetical protein
VGLHRLPVSAAALVAVLAAPAPVLAEPAVTLTPAAGPPGTVVRLSGEGFESRRRLLVWQEGKRPKRIRAGRGGTFRARVTIRPAATDTHTITTSAGRPRVVNQFLVGHPVGPATASERATSRGARVRWTPSASAAGAVVELSGSGFGRGQMVRAAFGAAAPATTRADARGRFAARVVVGAAPPGAARMTVRSDVAQFGIPFTVTPDPVIAAAGDIACDPRDPNFNGGAGTESACRQRATSDLLVAMKPAAVLVLGDIQYESSRPEDFLVSYGPTWGRVKDITWPVMGNHENAGGNPAAYFDYFGPRVGTPDRAFYSYDVGAWHLIALNSNYENCGCAKISPPIPTPASSPTSTTRASPPATTAASRRSSRCGMRSTPPAPISC